MNAINKQFCISVIMMTLSAMGITGTGLAHDEGTSMMPKAAAQKPFTFSIPANAGPYTSIAKPPNTVTMRSGLVVLAAGKDVGLHSTELNEEILVILEGQGEVVLQGFGHVKIAAGQIAYVPPKTRHNVFNRGTEPLKYIFIVAKALE